MDNPKLREALEKWDFTAFEIAWYQRLAEQPKTGVRPLRYDVKRDFHKAIFAAGFQAALSLSSPIEPPSERGLQVPTAGGTCTHCGEAVYANSGHYCSVVEISLK